MPLDDAYRAFVATQPEATVWHEPAMLAAVCSTDARLSVEYAGLREAGALVGVLPYCRKARLGGWAVVMPPLLRYCGPLFAGDYLMRVGTDGALRALWTVLPQGYRAYDQSWPPVPFAVDAMATADWPGEVIARRTHVIDLTAGPDAATAGRTKQMRRDLRRAAETLEAAFAKTIDAEVHNLLEAPYRRQGMAVPYARTVVDRLFAALPEGRIACARLRDGNGDLQAAAVYLADGQTGYAFLAGATTAARAYSGSNYAVALGAEWAAEMGLQRFDFLGSEAPRIADTLRRMGGVATAYGHLRHDAAWWMRAGRRVLRSADRRTA